VQAKGLKRNNFGTSSGKISTELQNKFDKIAVGMDPACKHRMKYKLIINVGNFL
jgi:hypothetical protein